MAQRQESYLTPVQQITEQSLAPRRLLDESMRVEQAIARNPLIESGPQLAVSAVPETIPAPPSNPLVRPPVPLSVMGTDQRIAWQQLQNEQEQDQMAREEAVLKAEADRRTRDLQREETRQSTAMLSEGVPKLQQALLSGNDDEYLAVKADLLSRFPVGAGSVEAARALKAFDDRYSKKAGAEAELNKARIARQEAAKQRREETILKQAWEQGPEVAREVAARMADPLKGTDDASALLAQVQEKSTTRALEDAGLSKEAIAQRYGGEGTGRPFDYQAARAAPKSRAFLTAERNKTGNEVMALEKMRADAELMGTWSEENQQILDEKRAYWRSLTPEIGDRAGVQGMATKYVPYERTLNPAARVLPPGTVPATAAKPSPTPAPPPLNPAYPEQWRGGKRYVQVNGQWYLSKVQ